MVLEGTNQFHLWLFFLEKGGLREMERKVERSPEQIQTKLLGVAVPLPVAREFRESASKEGISGTELLRRLIVSHLDKAAKK